MSVLHIREIKIMEISKVIIDTVIDGFAINYVPLEEQVYSSLEEACLQILLLAGESANLQVAEIQLRDVYRMKIVTVASTTVAVHKKAGDYVVMSLSDIHHNSEKWPYQPLHEAAKLLAALLEADE